MTKEEISKCTDDEELYKLISTELFEKTKDISIEETDRYIERLRELPKYLWALGAIYELDVSICKDDLGWHFGNNYHWEMAQETLKALKYIGAKNEAEIFEQAMKIVKKYWLELGRVLEKDNDEFPEWYENSPMYDELAPLDKQMWAIDKEKYLLQMFVEFIRNNSEAALSA